VTRPHVRPGFENAPEVSLPLLECLRAQSPLSRFYSLLVELYGLVQVLRRLLGQENVSVSAIW
jgi:hypothetical protein